MKPRVKVLLPGFPGKADLSYLGWSTVCLVETETTRILFDTGGQGARTQLLAALEAYGIVPADVDMVFLSHLHYDHCGNCTLFPNALFSLTDKEFFQAQQYANDPFLSRWTVEYLKYRKLQIIDRDCHEVAPGVVVWFTPGHTPGSASLVVDCDSDIWYLVGDAVKNRIELATGTADLSQDQKASASTIARFRQVKGVLVPGHDTLLQIDGGSFMPVGCPAVEITFPPGLTAKTAYLVKGHTTTLRITLE
ncbi:MAG: hypothetical protein PWQ41_968 [Bacillota bacterium]|nr:hypothetical protein [Bacillota bacterium]